MAAAKANPKADSRPRDRLPTILLVTPEINGLPADMGALAPRIRAKAGGLADVSASLFASLHARGFPVHLVLPNFARMFGFTSEADCRQGIAELNSRLPEPRIHLAEDWRFYGREHVYSNSESDNQDLSIAFQREIINRIISVVRPHLIHCNDWMTGLIPPTARARGIKSVFTIHNTHSCLRFRFPDLVSEGLDITGFPHNFYYLPLGGNHVDFLASGILSADHVNAVSPTYLAEIASGHHVPEHLRHVAGVLAEKKSHQAASDILNAPDATYDPTSDPYLDPADRFGPADHPAGKARCKARFQKQVGLPAAPDAPLFFWPSRLDPLQKGPQLLAEILPSVTHAHSGLQVAFVADGPYRAHLDHLVRSHKLHKQVVLVPFSEQLSHLGYAAADFMLMPSRYEPCGLAQMISPKYGTLPVAHDTGGIHDTVEPLDPARGTGNGFLFEHWDSTGLRWAMDQAVLFHRQPAPLRQRTIARIMTESAKRFDHGTTAQAYIDLYQRLLS